MDARGTDMELRLFGIAFGFSLMVSSSAVGNDRTASAPPPAAPSSGGESVEVQQILPYQFSKPHVERGLKIVLKTVIPPEGPRADSIVNAYFAASFSPQIKEDWEIVALNVYELGSEEKIIGRAESFYVNPSHCNDYCKGEIRYSVTDVKPGHRYRADYLLWPKRSNADVLAAVGSLRFSPRDVPTVKVRYEFADPYDHSPVHNSGRGPNASALLGH
jgi:hypothetical protein